MHGLVGRLAEPGGREVTGDTVDAEAVRTVRSHGDVDHRVVEPRPMRVSGPDRRVGGQLDNAFMLVAELELADRAHHAVAFDPANRRHLQGKVAAGYISARGAEDAF